MSYVLRSPEEVILPSINSISSLSPYSPLSPVIVTSESTVLSTMDTPYIATPGATLLSPLGTAIEPKTVPIIPTIGVNYVTPFTGLYSDLNSDHNVQQKIVKYIQMKALDKWLLEDLIDILNYFKIDSNGRVDVIDSFDQYNPSTIQKETLDQLEKKIDFIERFFLTKSVVNRVLNRIVRESSLQWVKIPKNTFIVRQAIEDKMMKLIKSAIALKNKK